jgi:mannose-6-phosphate isomerase-like protein (cupin superfamily)
MQTANLKMMIVTGLCAFSVFNVARAQQVDHYTPDSLLSEAKPLKEKAGATNGAASETLQKYGVDYTMLSVRNKDGVPELHEKFADIFVIIDGTATLISGGNLVNSQSINPGEFHGSAILEGKSTSLMKGDVVHIPPNTPHQLLIPKNVTLTYFVVKVKEKD